jgi:uncharacterized protein YjiK
MAIAPQKGPIAVGTGALPEEPKAREEPDTGEPPKTKKNKAEKKADKLRKQEDKRLRDAHRPLTSWERYRALRDAFDEGLELVDLADHKARFAFVIMGALNVVLLFVASRSQVVDNIPDAAWPWLGGYLALYGLVGVYFFLQAIESLRPRSIRPSVPQTEEFGIEDYPIGVRFFHDVLDRDVVSHLRAWRHIRMGQLNAEVARQAYALAAINKQKYRALNRLYLGLKVMTLLAAGLLVVIEIALATGSWAQSPPVALGTGQPERGGLNILGIPSRFPETGAKEPSGIAYHPDLDHFFLVGDEGSLVELDAHGAVLRKLSFRGNLEDVAFHPPTGHLVLLSEKRGELVLYDPNAGQEVKRWRLDSGSLLGRIPEERNLGFEGLSFREDSTLPGGGLFYLVHQRSPAMVVTIAFDVGAAKKSLDADSVVSRWSLKPFKDLTAATYVASLDRLLVISDTRDRLLVVRPDGTLESEIVLPGSQQEGICFDGEGNLWVADERAGLLRFDRALEELGKRVGPPAGS